MTVPGCLGILLSRWPSLGSIPLACILIGSHIASSAVLPKMPHGGRTNSLLGIAAAICLTVCVNYAAAARLIDNVMCFTILPAAFMFSKYIAVLAKSKCLPFEGDTYPSKRAGWEELTIPLHDKWQGKIHLDAGLFSSTSHSVGALNERWIIFFNPNGVSWREVR